MSIRLLWKKDDDKAYVARFAKRILLVYAQQGVGIYDENDVLHDPTWFIDVHNTLTDKHIDAGPFITNEDARAFAVRDYLGVLKPQPVPKPKPRIIEPV